MIPFRHVSNEDVPAVTGVILDQIVGIALKNDRLSVCADHGEMRSPVSSHARGRHADQGRPTGCSIAQIDVESGSEGAGAPIGWW